MRADENSGLVAVLGEQSIEECLIGERFAL
jgi:hypothetical protein